MKSRVIFAAAYRNMMRQMICGEDTISVEANFDDPVNWPFTVKYSEYSYSKNHKEQVLHKIPMSLFKEIQQIIESSKELVDSEEYIGVPESFDRRREYTLYFSCDLFSKKICGPDVYSDVVVRETMKRIGYALKDVDARIWSGGFKV